MIQENELRKLVGVAVLDVLRSRMEAAGMEVESGWHQRGCVGVVGVRRAACRKCSGCSKDKALCGGSKREGERLRVRIEIHVDRRLVVRYASGNKRTKRR